MDDFKMGKTLEMMRLTNIQNNMLNHANAAELLRVSKLSIKLMENSKWTRWGKDNADFLSRMEQKYC